MGEIERTEAVIGIHKSSIKPFHSQAYKNPLQIKIDARKV